MHYLGIGKAIYLLDQHESSFSSLLLIQLNIHAKKEKSKVTDMKRHKNLSSKSQNLQITDSKINPYKILQFTCNHPEF